MTEYHKINAPFKRHTSGPDKGRFIEGQWAMPELQYLAELDWEGTEKVDGTNIRAYLRLSGDVLVIEIKGRSDNANIPKHLLEYLEETFPTYPMWRRNLERPSFRPRHEEIRAWMMDNDLTEVTLYGEGYGPKIQAGGGNYRSDASFVLFDVKIGGFWLDRANVNDVASKLGIDSVPVLGVGNLWDWMRLVRGDYSKDGHEFIDAPHGRGLKSKWGNFEAEGVVVRPTVPLFTRKGERIITKIKAVDFR